MQPLHLDDDDSPPHSGLRRLVTVLVVAGVLVLAGLALHSFLSHPVEKGPVISQISLINQPPPPPPKPPEKPPEPPKPKEEVKVDTPQPPKPDDSKPADKPAPDKPLGVDAAPGNGTDSFGLASNKGGTDLIGSGGGGGGGAYYTGLLQRQFYEAMQRNRKVLKDDFRVVVKVWLADDGRVTKADIVSGSGNADIDQQVQVTLMDMPPLKEVPPASMRPVELRLSNRS